MKRPEFDPYPPPPVMPSVVEGGCVGWLERLETVLAFKAPAVARQLLPGLSSDQITALESKYEVVLTEEVRSLYSWHNGTAPECRAFFPVHSFNSFETAAEHLHQLNLQVEAMLDSDRDQFISECGYQLSWIPIFDDGCGDGYFFDHRRRDIAGSFFYSFAEDGEYVFYPSLSNFVAELTKCWDEGVFFRESDGNLNADFIRLNEIHDTFGKFCHI